MPTRFKNWLILPKIMTISVISVAVMLVATFAYFIPLMESRLMAGKKNGTRNVVEVAYGVIAAFDRQAESGVISREAAQARAIRRNPRPATRSVVPRGSRALGHQLLQHDLVERVAHHVAAVAFAEHQHRRARLLRDVPGLDLVAAGLEGARTGSEATGFGR